MEAHTHDLEARIVAIEYALQILVTGLSDRAAIDREKLLRLLRDGAEDARTTASNSNVPIALRALAERL